MITLGHRCRDNIYPLLSNPMIDFNIEPYETKSVDRKISSHRHNVKGSDPEDDPSLKYSLIN